MDNQTNHLSCLYYPFSRLLDSTTLKYLLLVFDSITFIDDVETKEWRRKLLQEIAKENSFYKSLEDISDDYDMLADTGAIHIANPRNLKTSKSRLVAIATQADLANIQFVEMASNPSLYDLPFIPLSYYDRTLPDRPTWQAFLGKIAEPLLTDERFLQNDIWMSHILVPGMLRSAWTFSYEAGSAAILNYYLEAAQELGLNLVTDSSLHHNLVKLKLKQIFEHRAEKEIDFVDNIERQRFQAIVGHRELIQLFGSLFSKNQLEKVRFSDIVKFRKETLELRHQCIDEINATMRVIASDPYKVEYEKTIIDAIRELEVKFNQLGNQISNNRDKLLPAFAKSVMYGTAGGSALSSVLTFLGGLSTENVVALSALTVSTAFLAEALEIWNEKRKVLREQRPSIMYLNKISKIAQ